MLWGWLRDSRFKKQAKSMLALGWSNDEIVSVGDANRKTHVKSFTVEDQHFCKGRLNLLATIIIY
ncbi:hypothetical protein [uncultured Tateyamaria sp.]|uniref:hypothetical protein n=1 Tax=uncultured Tateyamaria sp. TaxID=455651 RepID=UPI002635645F|nr:hypothetical protein [uncultured Tateyamaria sp.]